MLQIREEVGFTKGPIIVRGKLVSGGQAKRADYVLSYEPNIPLALIEAKDNYLNARRPAVSKGAMNALQWPRLHRRSAQILKYFTRLQNQCANFLEFGNGNMNCLCANVYCRKYT